MRLRNRKIYLSDSGTENSTMERSENSESQEDHGQGNFIGSIEEVSSVGTCEDENLENNKDMGNQQEAGCSQENSGNLNTELIRNLLEGVQSQLLNSMQGMEVGLSQN